MSKELPPSRTADQYVLRFPDGMRDRIAEVAKQNNRSMNAEIVARLQGSFGPRAAETGAHSIPEPLAVYVTEFAEKHKVSFEEALVRMLIGAGDGVSGSDVVLIVPRPGMSLGEMRAVMDMAKLEVPPDSHIIYDSRLQAALPPANFEEMKGEKSAAKKPSKTVKNAVVPFSAGSVLDHYDAVLKAREANRTPLVPKPPANKGPARSPNARKPKA